MKELRAVLFDLGNTLSRSASLSESLVDITNSPIAEKLNLSARQLLMMGVEIEQEISRLYETERWDQPDWRDVWKRGIKNSGFDYSDDEIEILCRTHLIQFVKNCEIESYSIPLLTNLRKANVTLAWYRM